MKECFLFIVFFLCFFSSGKSQNFTLKSNSLWSEISFDSNGNVNLEFFPVKYGQPDKSFVGYIFQINGPAEFICPDLSNGCDMTLAQSYPVMNWNVIEQQSINQVNNTGNQILLINGLSSNGVNFTVRFETTYDDVFTRNLSVPFTPSNQLSFASNFTMCEFWFENLPNNSYYFGWLASLIFPVGAPITPTLDLNPIPYLLEDIFTLPNVEFFFVEPLVSNQINRRADISKIDQGILLIKFALFQNASSVYYWFGIRAEDNSQYSTTSPQTTEIPVPTPVVTTTNSGMNVGLVVGLSVMALVLIATVLFILFLIYRRKHQSSKSFPKDDEEPPSGNLSNPTLENFKDVFIKDVELKSKIGEGHFRYPFFFFLCIFIFFYFSFTQVWLGVWEKNEVALKMLKDKDNISMQEFFTESRTLLKLRHPCIVNFYGIYIDIKDDLYMVTEFVPLGSLEAFLKSHPNLSLFQTVNFFLNGLSGLQYLEANKIIHRDIAARNFLVEGEPENYRIKVSDFGMSRYADKGFYVSTGKLKPVRWCSPEVLKFDTYSFKSDVWAFGITMWECFAKSPPYSEVSNADLIPKILEGHRLSQPENCPDQIFSLMMACWTEDPESRISFAELHKELTSQSLSIKKDSEYMPLKIEEKEN